MAADASTPSDDDAEPAAPRPHPSSDQPTAPAHGATPSIPPLMQPGEAFTELGQLVVGAQPLGVVLARVAELAAACIPGAEEVSVTLIEGDSGAHTAAFTGSLAAHLDERQYENGFGPCIDAAESGQTIRVDDTAQNANYPDFAATASRRGVRSTISVGMPMPQRILGGINVYRFDGATLDDDAVQLLQVFAGYAAVALANHSLYATSLALTSHLQTAMQSRAVIEQAKGVLMGRLRCTSDEAFQHLSAQSQRTNRKLRDIAADVISNL